MTNRPINARCIFCDARLLIRNDQLGRKIRCSQCRKAFVVDLPPAESELPEKKEEVDNTFTADDANEIVLAEPPLPSRNWGRAKISARFERNSTLLLDASVQAVRGCNCDVLEVDRQNLRIKFSFAINGRGSDHLLNIFRSGDDGSEIEIISMGPNVENQFDRYYQTIIRELGKYLMFAAPDGNQPLIGSKPLSLDDNEQDLDKSERKVRRESTSEHGRTKHYPDRDERDETAPVRDDDDHDDWRKRQRRWDSDADEETEYYRRRQKGLTPVGWMTVGYLAVAFGCFFIPMIGLYTKDYVAERELGLFKYEPLASQSGLQAIFAVWDFHDVVRWEIESSRRESFRTGDEGRRSSSIMEIQISHAILLIPIPIMLLLLIGLQTCLPRRKRYGSVMLIALICLSPIFLQYAIGFPLSDWPRKAANPPVTSAFEIRVRPAFVIFCISLVLATIPGILDLLSRQFRFDLPDWV